MSEVKLNLIDAQTIVVGKTHGAVADRYIAALSAEPETLGELVHALGRYMQPHDDFKLFAGFRPSSEVDPTPWDAGLIVIDLAARIVVTDSTYSKPGPEGVVHYHDGTKASEFPIQYRLPSDWLFVNSLEAYQWSRERHLEERKKKPPLDTRAVLYERPLLEYIVKSVDSLILEEGLITKATTTPSSSTPESDAQQEALIEKIKTIHANWLLTPREDLRGQSPREVMLENQDLIDFDLHTRSLQWSFLGEGPPCLQPDSFAYRFAGFGSHEWILYYGLIRHLLWNALELQLKNCDEDIVRLDQIKTDWLENGDEEHAGRAPANVINNERRRLPEVATAAELLIDEDCECCRMMAQDAELGLEVTFWHLDGCNMDDGFAFSSCLTMQEWEAEQRRREEFDRDFARDMEERERHRARGEPVEPFPWETNSLGPGEDPF